MATRRRPKKDDEDKAPRRLPVVRRHFLVITYDSPEDKRRHKVMKTLEGYARRVQYSVFECEISREDEEELKERLGKLIDEGQDDVRMYSLCDSCRKKIQHLGRAQPYARDAYRVV